MLHDIPNMEAVDEEAADFLRLLKKEERGCYHRLHAAL
jgi:hypothetical protein